MDATMEALETKTPSTQTPERTQSLNQIHNLDSIQPPTENGSPTLEEQLVTKAEGETRQTVFKGMPKSAALAAGLAIGLTGVGAGLKTSTADARLGSVGPALSKNKKKANNQFDWYLSKTGPNGPLAKSVARSLNIRTEQGRKKYVTPENIDLGRKVKATNKKYPLNTGVKGSSPVYTRNKHPVSEAYTVVSNTISSRSESRTHSTAEGKFEASLEVLRRLCENMLKKKGRHQSRSPVGSRVRADLSYGLKMDLKAMAASSSNSASGAEVTCPDGTRVRANSQAGSVALAAAAARIREKGDFVISGKGLTFTRLQMKYNARLNAIATAATSTSSSTMIEVACAKPPKHPPEEPPEEPPEQPPEKENKPPTGTPNPSYHRYVNAPGDEGEAECFDDIYDPDGDEVDLQDVRFVDEHGNLVGGVTSPVFKNGPAGNEQEVQCVYWNSGTQPQDHVYMVGTLNDHKGHKVTLKSGYSLPVLERPSLMKMSNLSNNSLAGGRKDA